MSKLSFYNELGRKSVHLSSSIIGFSILYFEHNIIFPFLLLITISFISFDFLRLNNDIIYNFYDNYFGSITRSFEDKKLTGASYVLAGSLLTYLLFDSKIAGISLLVMSLSDAMAAIVGVGFGSTKLLNKSLEGSFSFFFTTIIIFYFFNISYLIAFPIAFILTVIELIGIFNIDDNIIIPITTGLLLNLFTI